MIGSVKMGDDVLRKKIIGEYVWYQHKILFENSQVLGVVCPGCPVLKKAGLKILVSGERDYKSGQAGRHRMTVN